MNRCLICNSKTFLYKRINNIHINECPYCKLAFTVNPPNTTNLYNHNSTYSLKNYLIQKKDHQNKFEYISKQISRIIKRGNILEVGAGFGLFTKILSNNKKYYIEIIEPNLLLHFIQKNSKIIKHKENYETFLKQNKKKFDAIILLDVLEHFKKPDIILKQTNNIITEGGYIVLQFPNYTSIMAHICYNWSWWMLNDHKFHFSPSSAKLLLEKKGFNIVKITTYEGVNDFKKNLDGNFTSIKNTLLRKVIKSIYFICFFPLYFMLRKLLWSLGYGGLILVIAQKKPTIYSENKLV